MKKKKKKSCKHLNVHINKTLDTLQRVTFPRLSCADQASSVQKVCQKPELTLDHQ